MAAITLDIGGNTRQLDRDIQKTVNKVYTINLKTKGDQPLGRITGQVNEFNKSLDASNARVIAFGASAGIIFGVERAFGALVQATIEVQKSLQDINVILNASQANLQKFGAELFNIARNTGQSFQEVAKAATEFSRQGLGIEETLKRTNEALILSRLSGLDAAKSVESLTAAVNSFASQAVTATEVVNKFATVDAAFAVSSADLADAIARVGSSAAQSGVSLNELIAIVTSAQQTTARGGAVIGNSFKTIFTRLQREKVVDLLESLGISGTDSSGQVKSTIQLLQDLGAVYDTLGSQQQAYVAEQVGGVFQINILKAALADLGKEYSIYSSALNVAAGATDQAIRRNEELNKTYAAQINALAENARQLAAAGGERLLGPSIDRLVGGTNTLLEGFSESDGQGVGAVLGKGILDGIGQFIAGPGLALIGGVLLKLFRDLAKFATGSVQQLLGLNTAATQQRDLQQSINQILTKNPQLLELALKGSQGLNQAANSLLASLQKQTVELQKQAQVAQQISKAFVAQAGVRVAGGVPVVPTGKSGKPGKAAGYIPNFAEEFQAKEFGAKSNVKAVRGVGKIGGKSFEANNQELQFRNFAGTGETAVIPKYGNGIKEAANMIARGESGSVLDKSDRNRAKGFVPNFANSVRIADIATSNVRIRQKLESSLKNRGNLESNDQIQVQGIKSEYFNPNINKNMRTSGLSGKEYEKQTLKNVLKGGGWKDNRGLAWSGSSAIDAYRIKGQTIELAEMKGGRFLNQLVLNKFLRAIPENYGSNNELGNLFKENRPGEGLANIDRIGVKGVLVQASKPNQTSITSTFSQEKLLRAKAAENKANEKFFRDRFRKTFASGFIPNFAQGKNAIDLGDTRTSPALKGKVLSLIHPGISQGYSMTPATASYLGQQYRGLIPVAGINQQVIKGQLPDLDKNLGDLLVREANQFGQVIGGGNFLKSAQDLPNFGAAKGAVGVAFEGGLLTLLRQNIQKTAQNAGIDFRQNRITPKLRNLFHNAPGMYDAKYSPELVNDVMSKLLQEAKVGEVKKVKSGPGYKDYDEQRKSALNYIRSLPPSEQPRRGNALEAAIRKRIAEQARLKGAAAGYIPNFAAPLVRAVDDKELRMMLSKFGKGFAFQGKSSEQSALEFFGGSGTYMWDALSRPGEQMSDRQAYKQNIGRAKNWSTARKQSSWLVRYNRSKLKDSELLPDMETGGASVYGLPLSKDQIVWPIKQANGAGRIFEKDIPAFLSGQLNDAIKRESQAGVPKNKMYLAQEKALTGANPMGLGVFNKRDEPTKGSRKNAMRRKGFASGYIPNFAIEDPDVQATNLSSSVGAVVAQLGFLAFSLQGSRQQYKQSLKELTDSNIRAAKNNLRAAREAGASEQVRRQLSQNVRTAQAGTAGQKFAAASGAGGFALSIGAPIIAETIKNAIGQETAGARRTGEAVGAAGQIASFAGAGAMFGPWGAAIGAATGALLTVPGVIDSFLTDFPELQKESLKAAQELTQFGEASSRVIQASESYAAVLSNNMASAETVAKAQQSLAQALNSIPAEYRDRLAEAAGTGTIAEESAKIQGDLLRKSQIKESNAQLGKSAGEARSALAKSTLVDIFTRTVGAGQLFFGTARDALDKEENTNAINSVIQRSLTGGEFTPKVVKSLEKIPTISAKAVPRGGKEVVENTDDLRKFLEKTGQFDPSTIEKLIEQANIPGQFEKVVEDINQGIITTKNEARSTVDALTKANAKQKEYLENVRKASAAIDAASSSLEKRVAIENLFKSAFENLQENIRSFSQNLQIEQTLTRPREVLENLIGADKDPTRRLAAQEGLAGIRETERSGLATAGLELKGTIREILQKPFQENIDKLRENLGQTKEGFKGDSTQIESQTSEMINQTATEYQNLNSVMQSVEGYMAEFVSGQISTQQLLEQSRTELAGVGIDVSRGSQASDAIEKAVAELEVKTVQEQVKAFQQRAKLASETKQAILQSSVEQASKVFGGFERFTSGNAENNSIAKITDSLSAIESIRGSTAFRYTNIESQQVQESMRPELGRNFANLYTELINASGGAFRNYLQENIEKSRQETIARGGEFTTPSGLGGYDDIVKGIQADIENQLKEYEQTIQVTSDPVLKKDLQGFVDSIRGLGGGTLDIAKLQTMQGLGVARQTDYNAIYDRFENEALNKLKEISPELAVSLADVTSLTNDPILDQATYQSGLQTQMIGYLDVIQNAILQVAKGEPIKNIIGTELKAYQPKLTEEQKKVTNEIKNQQEIDKKVATVQNQALPKDNRTIAQIEAETRAKRDQKLGTQPQTRIYTGGYINGMRADEAILDSAGQQAQADFEQFRSKESERKAAADAELQRVLSEKEAYDAPARAEFERFRQSQQIIDPRNEYALEEDRVRREMIARERMIREGSTLPSSVQNQSIPATQQANINLGGINININSTAQITDQDYEQLKPRIEQLLQTEVPNMLTEIQNVKQEVSILGRTKETVDNLLKNGNFTQYAPPPKTR